jgi:hypothetical protein
MGESEVNGGSSGVIGQAQGRYNTRSNAVVSNRSVTRARRNKILGTNSVGNGIRNKAKIRDSKKHKKVKNYVVKSQIGFEVKDCNIFKSKKSGETNQG